MHQMLGLSKGYPCMDQVIPVINSDYFLTILYDKKIQIQYKFLFSK